MFSVTLLGDASHELSVSPCPNVRHWSHFLPRDSDLRKVQLRVASFDNEVSVPKTKKEEIARLSAAFLAAIDAPVPVNPTCKISKSTFMAGLQCAKRGYLQVRHPELASSVDDSRMQQGIEVGSLARQMFPGGVLVAADHRHLSDAIRDTRT